MPGIAYDEVYDALTTVAYASPWGPSTAAQLLTELLQQDCLPVDGECAAVSVTKPKTAALVYDRVWGLSGHVPNEIRFGGLSRSEIFLAAQQVIRWRAAGRPQIQVDQVADFYQALDRYFSIAESSLSDFIDHLPSSWIEPSRHSHIESGWAEPVSREFAAEIATRFSCAVVPVYGAQSAADTQFRPGDYSVVVTTITDLEIVDEGSLGWDQVLEFRRDLEAKAKYKRFIHWLDANMVGRDAAFIREEVAQRLEDYSWAIRKHGLKTVLGGLSSLLDEKRLIAAGSLLAGGVLLGTPEAGCAAGLIVWIGKVLIEAGKGLIDIEDAKRGPGSEIAYIYDVREKLGT